MMMMMISGVSSFISGPETTFMLHGSIVSMKNLSTTPGCDPSISRFDFNKKSGRNKFSKKKIIFKFVIIGYHHFPLNNQKKIMSQNNKKYFIHMKNQNQNLWEKKFWESHTIKDIIIIISLQNILSKKNSHINERTHIHIYKRPL